MKSYAISLLALALSSSGSSDPAALPKEKAAIGMVGFSADRLTDFVRDGISVFDHLNPEQQADVRSCRLTQDVARGIRAAMKASARSGSAGRVILPDGCYRIGSSILLPSNIELVGASMRGTRIMPDGDFPAMLAAGRYADGLTGIGVQNMSIFCAGMAKEQANGIKLVYVNRGNLKDLYFNGCHRALDLYDQWQTKIDNIQVDGLGAQQNGVGVYMGAPTDAANRAPNNAVILTNSTVQNVDQYGFQLLFFAGSKFVNDEAMNGVTGWKLCGSAYVIPDQACQFGHFMNIVTDSTRGPGIVVDQSGNTRPVNNVMFDHVWIGSSQGHGITLAGVTYSQFDNLHITKSDIAVHIRNSNNVKVSANIEQYNQNDNASLAAIIDGGHDNILWANNSRSDHPTGYNGIAETGPTYGNAIWGGLANCTPSLQFGKGGQDRRGDAAYRMRTCRYEVQGRHVRMQFQLALSALGASDGAARIADLPFRADDKSAAGSVAGTVVAKGMNGLGGNVIAQINPGEASAGLSMQGAGDVVPLTRTKFTPTSTLSGMLDYVKK